MPSQFSNRHLSNFLSSLSSKCRSREGASLIFFLHLHLHSIDNQPFLPPPEILQIFFQRPNSPDSEKKFFFDGKANTWWTTDGACRLSHGSEAPRRVEGSHHVYPLWLRGPEERLLACSSSVSAGTATSALTFSVE